MFQEQEAREAMEELERRMEETRLKEQESHRLAEELEQARLKMEENQRALEEALKTPPHAHVIVIDQGPDDDDKTSENSMSLFSDRVLFVCSCLHSFIHSELLYSSCPR